MLRIDQQLFPWNQFNCSAATCAEGCWVNSQRVNLCLMNLTSQYVQEQITIFPFFATQAFSEMLQGLLAACRVCVIFLADSCCVHWIYEGSCQILRSSSGLGELCPLGMLSTAPSHTDLFHLKVYCLQAKPSCCKETMHKRSMSTDKEKAGSDLGEDLQDFFSLLAQLQCWKP